MSSKLLFRPGETTIYIYIHIHINNGINEISVESNRSIREEPNNFPFVSFLEQTFGTIRKFKSCVKEERLLYFSFFFQKNVENSG